VSGFVKAKRNEKQSKETNAQRGVLARIGVPAEWTPKRFFSTKHKRLVKPDRVGQRQPNEEIESDRLPKGVYICGI